MDQISPSERCPNCDVACFDKWCKLHCSHAYEYMRIESNKLKQTELERKRKIKERNNHERSVKCLNNGAVFETDKMASEFLGLNLKGIRNSCYSEFKTFGLKFVWVPLEPGASPGYDELEELAGIIEHSKDHKSPAVMCITRSQIYDSVELAAEATGETVRNIRRVCNGDLYSIHGMQFAWWRGNNEPKV